MGAGKPACGFRRFPKSAVPKGGDHLALIASGMAAHEHLAAFAIGDRQARLAILVRRAACHPGGAHLAPAEPLRESGC